ncbi:hypothetical protein FACS1894151_03220 [Spirochaetia bacterium]|nr:hypothetical protein FACS1894151_03220 [Spirochaetia bacterium]
MMRRFHFCLFFLAVLVLSASAQEGSGIGISIRFYDKRIYYVQDDPVFVQVTIYNNSPATYRFKLADERAFTVDFDIRTLANRTVESSDVLIRKRTASSQVFFREVTVESGESFSFVEDLRDYAKLLDAGSFVVQARIYPELFRAESGSALRRVISDQAPLLSNRLSLTMRPPVLIGPNGTPLEMDRDTNAPLLREKISPDQVVEYTITARQKEQWEKFFLYIDLESMIARDGSRQRQWQNESEEGRRRMMARYRTDLQSSLVDGDIATIPTEFTIERTTYDSEEGTVTVLEKFRGAYYTERKRYTYYLRHRDGVWTIVNYTVVNLGTE